MLEGQLGITEELKAELVDTVDEPTTKGTDIVWFSDRPLIVAWIDRKGRILKIETVTYSE